MKKKSLVIYNDTKDIQLHTIFSMPLMLWYEIHKRLLPWRDTTDPYKIWLSEIILQQTKVAQGLPYYQKFIEEYPTIYDLASSNEASILRSWQGLGYYTRARNLHTCARIIVEQFSGEFPTTYRDLIRLPGIGPYTAAAIASFAFKEAVPVLDGNVYRVLSRFFAIEIPINTTKGRYIFNNLAHKLVPSLPDVYNQAIMEFGALQCTPYKPYCTDCILKIDCQAFATGKQEMLPIKEMTLKIKHRFLHYLVLETEGQIFMKERQKGDIWTGLYDFYLLEDTQPKEFDQLSDELIVLIKKHNLAVKKVYKLYKHVLTHQRLFVSFFRITVSEEFIQEAQYILKNNLICPFYLNETKSLPKSILICKFLEENVYLHH